MMLLSVHVGSTIEQMRPWILVKTLYDNLGVNSVVHTLTNRLPDVIDCDRCTVFVIDSQATRCGRSKAT